MTAKDIRWIQRYNNFNKAFGQLSDAVKLAEQRQLSKLEEQGLIQAFEYTHELAWNTLKDFLENRGMQNMYGSRDATREAFKAGLIENGETWMEMIDSRNQLRILIIKRLLPKLFRRLLIHILLSSRNCKPE
jgi:nucleotidyltransferase substrate binding protein (TIGR01987 family)